MNRSQRTLILSESMHKLWLLLIHFKPQIDQFRFGFLFHEFRFYTTCYSNNDHKMMVFNFGAVKKSRLLTVENWFRFCDDNNKNKNRWVLLIE